MSAFVRGVGRLIKMFQVAIAALSVVSCGGSGSDEPREPPPPASGMFLYTATQPNRVSGFSIDSTTGALTGIPGSPFSTNGHPLPEDLSVVQAGRFLFVAGSSGGTAPEYSLMGYQINAASGALSPIPGMPITSSTSFTRAVFHPNGRALYLPAGSEGLRAYSIDPATGALTPVPGQPYHLPDDWLPSSGAFDRSGTMLLAASEPPSGQAQPTRSRVSALAVDATTGALTLRGMVDSARAVGSIVVHPDGKHAYSYGNTGVVGLIGVENPASPTIADAALPTVGPGSAYFSFGAILEEGGQHLYLGLSIQSLAGGRPDYVFAYQIDTASGALASAGSPVNVAGVSNSVPGMRGFAMHPTRRFIVATRFRSPNIAVFERNTSTGELKHVPDSPFTPTVGTSPLGVTFDASGKFAYLPDSDSFSISAYSFDSTNGRLNFISTYPLGSRPGTLARIAQPQ